MSSKTIRQALVPLIKMLGSDNDAEALAAVRAIGRKLKANGFDWHDLAAEIGKSPVRRMMRVVIMQAEQAKR